jgi:hypothetical protein
MNDHTRPERPPHQPTTRQAGGMTTDDQPDGLTTSPIPQLDGATETAAVPTSAKTKTNQKTSRSDHPDQIAGNRATLAG